MLQFTNDLVSEDKLGCQSFGIVSTISDVIIPCVFSINLAYSFAKQGFKTLLVDLDLSHPVMNLLFTNKFFFGFTTNKLFDQPNDIDFIEEHAYSVDFPTKGLLTIIPANFDMKSRMKFQSMSNTERKSNLIKLLDFIKAIKEKYNFIILNMPNGSDLNLLSQSCLISDHNFLLIDQNNISIGYGIDLVTNLEAIHPLIEFKGLILYNYQFNVNFVNDERPLIEQTFNLPVIATIPSVSSTDLLMLLDEYHFNVKLYNYYKVLSQELYKFMNNPSQFITTSSQKNEIIEVLIVANKAGIPLFTSYLKDSGSNKSTILSKDEILASATLTAIVTGITEVIKELTEDLSGETKLIKQKHMSLIIEHDHPLRALMLTQRNEDDVRSKMLIFLNLFKQKYKDEILSFVGSPKSFREAQFLVEEVF